MPPRWITAIDLLALVLLAMLIRSLLGDGYQIRFTRSLVLSLDSALRLTGWLVALLVVRHILWRAVPWHARVVAWMRRAVAARALRAAWPAFALSRVLVLLAGAAAVLTIGFDGAPPWRDEGNLFVALYARWDAGWYLGIAREGYPATFNPARASPLAFFPGLPLLMRGTASLLDVKELTAAVVLVTVSFLWGLTYVYRLARTAMTDEQARAAVLLLAFYPFAVAYSAALTESVFLLAAAGAFYHFGRSQLTAAAAFGLLAGIVRPNGFLLCVPLGLMAVLPFAAGRGWWPAQERADVSWRSLGAQLAVAAVPVGGMLLYAAHVHSLVGDPFAWMKAQEAWGRGSTEGFNVAAARWALIDTQGLSAYVRAYPIEIFEAAAALFALGAVWPITRRFGLAYGVFVAMAILPPLVTMGSVSLGRYAAPLFPIFLWLGAAVPERRLPYWVAVFAAGQALVAVLFYTWRPPY